MATSTLAASDDRLGLADVRRRIKAIFIGSVGNLVEWYDFYAYAAFALYFASAFFPSYQRRNREVKIDCTSFGTIDPWTLQGVLRHELGHTIGLRHEHTRPESGTCFEDNNWAALTAYDSSSVMHYPQCNGTNTWALNLTTKDKTGAAALYP